ncbi:hypothetical protein BNJ_00014 [Kaumoebavirus]|uniref:hypothetical protein n=1 Tax=Kaumoebavirus TaxID=1859492 RepID=UPI0009C1BEBE|nr:hypothetical protein BNJ_00014 [Kaumoebavirus]ARA71859.1 hypothetical protein BNJ_00014 [Kaumoebavirus]
MQVTQIGNYEYVLKYCGQCGEVEKRTIRKVEGEVIAEVPGYFHEVQPYTSWEAREEMMSEFEAKLDKFWSCEL